MKPSKFYINLGQKIREIRRSKDINQERLGRVLGLHQTAVCRVEKGFQSLTVHEIVKLADFFGMSVDALLTENKKRTV